MDTETMILDDSYDQELSTVSNEVVDATSYAVERASASDASRPVDDFFTVSLCYQDSRCPNEINSTFSFKKDVQDILGVVVDELDKIGDHVHANAYDCVVDVVQESCDLLLQQVSHVGRKSLAMLVNVHVDGSALADDVDRSEYDMYYGDTMDDEEEMYYGEMMDYDDVDIQEEEEDDEETVGVTAVTSVDVKKFMSSSGCVKFICGDQISNRTGVTECCSICLEEFEKRGNKYGDSNKQQQDDGVAVLPCGHVLHADCLVPWITRGKDTCPLCRFKLIIPC